ncbi:hypothetical protein N7499_010155 [Penicillium canescens]|uniref:LysM domain-containing protein n=1 Tax=Penicillium canescens TaxID=5083 RepID=A0AAD6IM04_PENCN|nr:uncharacterized protein N7446_007704 [Penicillium canescens]KAJ6018653.1 hypothetical protein N7522_000720 [Penicillium canescens]KAJ6033999.1 hypothetical protein N7444_011770 [Penicillium canescens]KAJ6056813.1 hypothetical protein N7460_000087 [Penicillium canescens]KAJ6058121.1 hypothetical protein N7446_007704 [Penicillium canescens]KAJ6072141.1 hypothetical protein N7499_010155 [Penicillium canescens]
MATTLRTLLVAVGFVFSAAVASPSMPTGEPEAHQVGDCTAWYSPQLKTPPETCTDVVNMHPGLDLATFLKLNPTIHPYCDNMLIGQKVCVGATQQNDSPKPAEPSPKSQETGPQQWESSPKQWETSATPKPQETGPKPQETGSQQWESSPKQWETSAAPKPQETSSSASHGWH